MKHVVVNNFFCCVFDYYGAVNE